MIFNISWEAQIPPPLPPVRSSMKQGRPRFEIIDHATAGSWIRATYKVKYANTNRLHLDEPIEQCLVSQGQLLGTVAIVKQLSQPFPSLHVHETLPISLMSPLS